MIIVSDFLRAHLVELKTLGFGFSAMTDPTDPYEREGCLDVLRDWGWSGHAHNSPQWLWAEATAAGRARAVSAVDN
jgi:hypothetical protein